MGKKGNKKAEKTRGFCHRGKGSKAVKNKGREVYDYDNSSYRAFVEALLTEGLEVHRVDGDGNCLFRALARQLYGDEQAYFQVRQEVMGYIVSERDHFELFMEDDEPFDDYVSRLRTNGEWGGNAEVFAAAQLYRADISIYREDMPRYVLQCNSGKVSRHIYLSFHGECHYNSLEALEGSRAAPAPTRLRPEEERSIKAMSASYDSLAVTKMSKKEKRDLKKGRNLSRSAKYRSADNDVTLDSGESGLGEEGLRTEACEPLQILI